MSLYDFNESLGLNRKDVGFNSLIMAAMLKADTINMHKLKCAFPEMYEEVNLRYNAPGGVLEGDN